MSEIKNIELKGVQLRMVKLDNDKVPFKPAVAKKMKDLGYDSYAKLTYNGAMFTSHDKEFIQLMKNKDVYYLELKPVKAPADGDKPERDSYEIVGYYSRKEHLDAIADETLEVKSKFVQSFYNIENFKTNPDLLNQLSNIDKIVGESA